MIVTTNHLVEYSREFSWSNERAFLQGGTGIFFGFSIDGENIIPKGNLKVEELSGKVIIPSNAKQKIKAELEALGVNGKILYNRDKTREAKLEYGICEEQDTSKHLFAKVIVFVKISDIIFSQIEIEKITDDVWHKMKRKYGKDSRIFIYVYYDEEDKRIGNWILFTSLGLKNLMEYKIKFNPRYYFRRMEHLNDEVSFKEIYESTEPIVQKCKNTFEMVEKWHSDFCGDTLSLEMYKRNLENAMKELLPIIFDKLQMISHGQKKYDDYYHGGAYFCESVDAVIRDQLTYIDQGENKQSLLFNYKFRIEKCKKYWREFEAAKRVHADDLTYFM